MVIINTLNLKIPAMKRKSLLCLFLIISVAIHGNIYFKHLGKSDGLSQISVSYTHLKLNPVYHLPLTKKMYDTLLGNKKLISKIIMEPEAYAGQMYPLNLYTKWDRNKDVYKRQMKD